MKALWIFGSLLLINGVSMAGVRVNKIQFNGSGCPVGSGVSHRWDQGELVLNFVDFAASRSNGLPLSNSRKNCVLTLDMVGDEGTSFTISSTSGRGRAKLNAGTQLVLSSSYFFQGAGETTSGSYTLKGSFYGEYTTGNIFADAQKQWSPCTADRALSLNSAIRIVPAAGASKIDGDAYLDELRLKIETQSCR